MSAKETKPVVKQKQEVQDVVNVVDEGVTEIKEAGNVMNLMVDNVKSPGNWKKVTREELAQLEQRGKLVGYDPATGEVLIKEN
jgi:hypothetical protein